MEDSTSSDSAKVIQHNLNTYGTTSTGFHYADERDALIANLNNMLQFSKLSDVIVEVGGKKFRLHKFMLAARSPVFYQMFKGNSDEANSGRITMTDISKEAFEMAVKYIYTGGRYHIEEKYLLELLPFAEKYQMLSMKHMCIKKLNASLTIESVVDMLIYAEEHDSIILKDHCLKYICEHLNDVKHHDSWSRVKSCSELMEDLREKLLEVVED